MKEPMTQKMPDSKKQTSKNQKAAFAHLNIDDVAPHDTLVSGHT